MTSADPFHDDQEAARQLLFEAQALLLDFDGPICSIFAGISAPYVASELRRAIADASHSKLPPDIASTDDPFVVFNFAATLGNQEAQYIEAALRAYEVEAVVNATATDGAHALMRTWRASGGLLAVVSNNSTAAVGAYLQLHDLEETVDYVSARVDSNPAHLKPAPHLIHQALHHLPAAAQACILVGDSTSDLAAARAAGVQAVGYANKPHKVNEMRRYSVPVITNMKSLT